MEQTQKIIDLSSVTAVNLDQMESMCACNSSDDAPY